MHGLKRTSGAPTACPGEEVIAAFIDGALSTPSREVVDAHVAECDVCRAIVATQTTDSGRATPGEPSGRDEAKAEAHARAGEVIEGKWRLVDLLGVGGMGQVFTAEHVETGRRVAMKTLRAELANEPEIVRRFVREAYTANRIEHPAFVRVLDDGKTSSGSPYFAMDLVEGSTLRKLVVTNGPFSEDRVRAVGARILEAVAAAHEAGVLHRDLKPDNILIDAEDRVRILDLGIARLSRGGAEASAHDTITGQMLGTPAYMPPEQARGIPAEVDERVDLFAVGATMCFLATGKGIRSRTGTLFEAMTKPVRPVRVLAPQLSRSLARVLDRALAFNKRDRYASAIEMRAAVLSEVSGTEGGDNDGDHVAEEPTLDAHVDGGRADAKLAPRPADRSRRTWLGLAIAGPLVALTLVLVARARHTEGPTPAAAPAPSAAVTPADVPIEPPPAVPLPPEPPAASVPAPAAASAPPPRGRASSTVATGGSKASVRPMTSASPTPTSSSSSSVAPRAAAADASSPELPKDMSHNPYR